MKLHLPVLLRKALLACFAFTFACSATSAAADLTLGGDASLTIDYAAANSIPDLAGGTLQLSGDTILLLSNCGVGDGKTYTLLTGVGALLDAEGKPLTLTDVNNAASLYFDTSRPGSGFWADGWLQLASDGSVQIVLHAEDVQEALTITTRQTGSKTYNYYENIFFQNTASSSTDSAWGGAIYGSSSSTITLSNNGSVVFVGNKASSSSYASGGAIYGWSSTITLSDNGSVTFSGNTASGSNGGNGGAIYGGISTIKLSDNGSVTFSGNTASSYGGAIYGDSDSTITLSDNGSVTFSGNTASGSNGGYGHGGAIYGWSSTITLSDNGSVTFSGNTTSYSGGAIDGSTITLSNNGSVTFSGNTTSGSNGGYGYGGAIDGSTITLSDNGSVTFSGNTASGSNGGNGGAIDSSTITLSDNGSVTFSGNTASSYGGAIHVLGEDDGLYITGNALGTNEDGSLQQVLFENNGVKGEDVHGGAIMAGVGAALVINNNGEVVFKGNYAQDDSYFSAHTSGGAICKQYGIFSIQNNASVIFEGNYTLNKDGVRLQSIYAYDESGLDGKMVVNFSAPEGGKIEFRDSIDITAYWSSSSALRINAQYENEPGTLIAQTGDVIFTGAYATRETLTDILEKHDRWIVTDAEIENSKHSTFCGVAQLYDGRLIIRDGAVIDAYGINVNASASGESTPTLMLHHGTLTSYADQQYATNAVTIAGGGSLSLAGQNEMRFSSLTLSGGSSLIVNVDNTHTTSAALTLNSSTLTISGELMLKLNAAAGITDGQTFALLTGVSQPTNWTSTNITVTSGTAGWDVSFDDLSWIGDTLWLYYDSRPDLVTATWTNETADSKWNTTSVNWEQDEVDYEYKNGVAVVFGDEGAGTVKLVGNIAPKSVLVNSAEYYTWEIDDSEGGKLTGSMKLTKQGAGTLEIKTSNDYTGGTLILGGKLIAGHENALGTGEVVLNGGTLEITVTGLANTLANTGTSTLKVSNGKTHSLAGTINNSGELTLEGLFDATALATAIGETHIDAIGQEGNSGFLKTAGKEVDIMTGSGTLVNNGTVSIDGTTVTLDSTGYGKAGAELQLGTYTIVDGTHSVEAILRKSATANIILEAGTLTADASTDALTATGGTINMSDAIELGGSISGTELNISAGKLTATLSNTNTLNATGWQMDHTITNNGTLTLTGTVDASALATTIGETHIDATGQEGNSGFLKTAGKEVDIMTGSGTLVNNGTVSIDGTTVTLDDKGYGKTGVELQLGTYTIVDGAHSVEAILRKSATANIILEAGTLTADASTDALTATGGIINMSDAIELGGSISGTELNISAGKLTAVLSGENTLNATDWSMSQAITNNGTLTLEGTVDATTLATAIDETHIDASGQEGNSGFLKTAGKEVDIMTGSGTLVNNGTVSIGGTTVTLDDKGYGKTGAELQLGTYTIVDGTHSVEAILGKSATANIILEAGTLTADASTDALTATGGIINMSDAIELGGSISGTELNISAGKLTATLSNTNTLNATGWQMDHTITNNGTLTLTGTVDASALATTIGETHIDATGQEGNSGFLKTAGKEVDIMTGSGTLVNNGTVSIDGTTVTLDDKGYGKTGAELQLGTYTIVDGAHSVEAILRKSATADIILESGTLTADASTNALTATGGVINMNEAVELGGSISGTELNISAGKLTATLDGENTLNATDWSMSQAITNNGTLTLEGTIDATALSTTIAQTHIDATGQEGNSGFLKTAGKEVDIMTGSGTLVNNGTVSIDGTTVTLDDKGYGKTGAELQLGTYTIVDGTHSVAAILGKSATADIILNAGGTLTADASTDALTATGGTINMDEAIELGGSISGTELNVSAGKLTATLSGENTLNATGWNISQAITNNGTLTLTGTVDASALATAIGETHIDATGQEGNSGFLKTAGMEVDIMTGSGTLVNNGTVSISGTMVTLDDKGYGKTGAELQLGTYTIVDGTHSVEAILGKSATADIILESGTLTADASTDALTATGGIINMSDAIELGGSISGTELNISAGKLTAVLSGENTLNATGWNISQAITNNGTLILTGMVDASALATHTEEMLVNTSLSESSSGFLKTAGSSVTIMSGSGTLDTSGAEILVNGQTVTLDERGYGQLGQVINYTQYTINGTDSEFVESIMRAAAGHAASTDIVMNGGELSVNANVTGNLSLTGTAYASVDAAASVFGDVVLDGGTLVLIGNKLTVNGKLDVESATDLLVRNYESEGLFTLISFGSFEGNLSDMNLVEQLRFSSKKTLMTTDNSVMMVVGDKLEWTGGNITAGVLEDMEISYKGDSNTAAEITGSSSVTVDSGVVKLVSDNRYTGGTVVNGGKLIAGHNNAFGSGDVIVNNGGTLDLSTYVVPNKVFMNGTSTLANANGASHIVLGGGSQVSFSNGFTLGCGKTLEVATGGATYKGALTLGGGTLELSDQLIVQGDVVFEAGKSTTIDISGWTTAGDGTVLVDFGSRNSGYADGCLTLSGIAGDWKLAFDAATGLLTLAAVQNQPVLPPVVFEPNLDRNQQEVYDTVKDIMADGNPGGVLELLGQNIVGSRDEAALKRALDEISGREYATIMSSQVEGNLGHLRRLRAAAGMGTPLGEYVTFSCCYPSNKGVDKSDNKGATVMMAPSPVLDSRRIRAGVSAFHEQAELDADSNGEGFERSETGAQLTMEYLVSNDFVLGMGLSHSRTKLSPTYGKRRDEDNTHVDLYGVYQSGRWSSTTALGVGLHQHELGRTVAGMQTEAEADGLSVNFLQDVAYSVYADEEQGLQVFGSVESSFNQVDAFSETGAGNASLCVEEQDAWVTDVTLGLRYNHTLPALGKAPAGMFSVQGGVVASLGDTEPEATLRFAGAPGYSYKQYAAERSRWGYSVGASVNMPVSASTAVFGTAEAVLRNNAYTVDAQVGVKMAF